MTRSSSPSRTVALSRRGLLERMGWSTLVAGLLGTRQAAAAPVPSGYMDHAERLHVSIEDAHITLGPAGRDPGLTSFLTIGNIVKVDGQTVTGKFFSKGLLTDEEALDDLGYSASRLTPGTPDGDGFNYVDHRFRIDGRGTLHGSGDELDASGDSLAIVGGTGEFVGAWGTYSVVGGPIPLLHGRLEVTFHLWRR